MNSVEKIASVIEYAHAYEPTSLFEVLETTEHGLSEASVSQRQERYGQNTLPMAPPKPAWLQFVLQFHNVLIYVLLGSAFISLILQHYVDGGVIFAVVIINSIVGFIQEGKAEHALRAIMSMAKTQCMVVREGALHSVDSQLLVPGDIVMLQAGDRVPADIRLFYNKDLRCDESALTGESQAVGKHVERVKDDVALAERKNMAFMGTLVTSGMARGIVCQTGLRTQIGNISELVQSVELPQTPLQKQLKRFAQQLTIGIIVVSLLTMLIGIFYQNLNMTEMFQAAIGIAVASIPEGLPAVVTIVLALGVQRMAGNRAVVRRLPAVEVLGSVDVICSDKTGTLTANEMTARELVTASNHYVVTGEGYNPEGAINDADTKQSASLSQGGPLTQACLTALLCNDANIKAKNQENGRTEWELHGDPTEGALMALALKHGLTVSSSQIEWPRIDILPFESDRRYMVTLHRNLEGTQLLAVKGAPDRLLQYCQRQQGTAGPEPINVERWTIAMEKMAQNGMRVMALAVRLMDQQQLSLNHSMVESDLTMVALVGISDPPRPEAISSIKSCHTAGIRVKMITGDNSITASAIGKELGLRADRVLTGAELDQMDSPTLSRAVDEVDIFARTSPANKLQLVHALQSNKHVVAMTGDGVNDAPALKQADIGVAMGNKGTDAAKEASDFILTDDRFSTIVKAIEEGRTVYDNIVKSIIFILPTNFAEAGVIIAAILSGRVLPITPAQILWVNMITAVTLALSLAFEKSESSIMRRPPRAYGQGLITPALLVRTLLVGVCGTIIVFSLFTHYRNLGSSVELARTVAVNALVMVEVFYLLNCRFLKQSLFSRDMLSGIKPIAIAIGTVLLMQVLFSYLPASQRLFGLESLRGYDWFVISIVSMPMLFIIELEKYIWRTLSEMKKS